MTAAPAIRVARFEARRDAPPRETEQKTKVFTFVASDGEFDRYQDRLNVQGWKLDGYNANGVVLFNHDDGAPSLFAPGSGALPIGTGRAFVEGDKLMVEIEFDQSDEFAKRIEGKVERRMLNTVSVRYLLAPGKVKKNERGGYDSDEQELLEISVVTIPGNPRAFRVKRFDMDDLADAIAQRMAPAAPVFVPVPVPAPATPEAVAAPLTFDAEALSRAVAESFMKSLKEQR